MKICQSILSRRALLLSAALALAAPVSAQTYPARPVQVIVPASVGTVVDATARLLAQHLSKALGQPVVVENQPAAGGVPGTDKMVKSPKDGYTLAVVSSNHAINPGIFKAMPFDSVKDVAPIAILGSTALVLVANPALNVKTTRELVVLARSKPGALNYGSTGNGSVLQLAGVLLNSEAGTDIKHIPYLAFGQMLIDVMAGRVDIAFSGVGPVAGHIKAGKLVPIGVSTQVRSGILPDVPTLAETGLPNYRFDSWLALVAPAGTPKAVIDRLNTEVQAVLALKEVQDTLGAQGVMPAATTPEAAARFFEAEVAKHQAMLKQAGVEPQ